MGRYLNPAGMTKEQWLAENAEEVSFPPSTSPYNGKYVVCLVNNGPFNAAALAYDDRELAAFTDPGDRRPKKWFLVNKDQAGMFQ